MSRERPYSKFMPKKFFLPFMLIPPLIGSLLLAMPWYLAKAFFTSSMLKETAAITLRGLVLRSVIQASFSVPQEPQTFLSLYLTAISNVMKSASSCIACVSLFTNSSRLRRYEVTLSGQNHRDSQNPEIQLNHHPTA